MKIKTIKIQNFRGIHRFDYDCSESMNVFIGVNGSGKSTLLDAIDMLFSWFVALVRNPKGNGSTLRDSDIRQGESFAQMTITIIDGDSEVSWQLYRQRATIRTASPEKTELKELRTWVNRLVENHTEAIPLYKKYHVHRRVAEQIPLRIRKRNFNKYSIYEPSEGQLNYRAFFTSFREFEDLENERYREGNPQPVVELDAIRQAIQRVFFGDYGDFRVKRRPRSFVLVKNGQEFRIEQLSDGEKAYITLVADIARCLAMTNSNVQDVLEAEGVILIDELDLHLHPQWQAEIVAKLRQTFPNCQFFLSTHSPFVVSSLLRDKDTLFTLRDGVGTEATPDYYGSAVGDILLGGFGMQSLRAKHSQDLIDEAWTYLKRDQKVDFSKVLSRLKNILSPSDPEFVHMALQEKLNEKLRLDNEKD